MYIRYKIFTISNGIELKQHSVWCFKRKSEAESYLSKIQSKEHFVIMPVYGIHSECVSPLMSMRQLRESSHHLARLKGEIENKITSNKNI